MPFLELQNVSKGYGGTEVLQNINLNVERGEFVAIVGYSGAGKTTLISMIAGLLRPDQGTVKLNGEVITEPGPDRALVFQNYSLLPWLSVFENIMLAVEQVFPQWPRLKQFQHTGKYLAMVNLSPARNKKPFRAACASASRSPARWRWTRRCS
jgi:nitrate/nitrite transport system ATP-binding protein